MTPPSTDLPDIQGAEAAFREAFARLCAGKPNVLPPGTAVTQNNVAREANRDPSALKKSRYPGLIQDIQTWVKAQANRPTTIQTPRQAAQSARNRSRKLRERIEELKRDRDHAQCLLIAAQRVIIELNKEVHKLRAAAPTNVSPLMPLQPSERQRTTKPKGIAG